MTLCGKVSAERGVLQRSSDRDAAGYCAPHEEIALWLYCFTISSVSRRHTAYVEGSGEGKM
jgi:hypothetical protein